MEDSLLTKNEDMTSDGSSSTNDDHDVNITINDSQRSSTPYEAEGVEWCNPCTKERALGLIDFILLLVQFVAAIAVLTRAKDEHPESGYVFWIMVYTCILPIQLMHIILAGCKSYPEMILDYFYVFWPSLLFWIYVNSSSSLYDSTQHFWLCVAFLAYSILRYAPVHPKGAAFCSVFVVLLWIRYIVIDEDTPNIVDYVLIVVLVVICRIAKKVAASCD